ncbi:hypothetical protein LZ30DRAFT_91624 [Colletotrichum cereale]|nr:hypothetical protein LZ30DRAFT_91624 [Colletotrichum cereale]
MLAEMIHTERWAWGGLRKRKGALLVPFSPIIWQPITTTLAKASFYMEPGNLQSSLPQHVKSDATHIRPHAGSGRVQSVLDPLSRISGNTGPEALEPMCPTTFDILPGSGHGIFDQGLESGPGTVGAGDLLYVPRIYANKQTLVEREYQRRSHSGNPAPRRMKTSLEPGIAECGATLSSLSPFQDSE